MLAPLLRFHHHTADYLANVVLLCPLLASSGLLTSVMHRARPARGVAGAAGAG